MVASLLAAALLSSQAAFPQPITPRNDAQPLYDPERPVQRLARDSFTLQYFTRVPTETRVQVRAGEVPDSAYDPEGLRPNPWGEDADFGVFELPGERTFHEIEIDGLEPGTKYFYRIYDPGAEPRGLAADFGAAPPWRREYAVSTLAPEGYKTVIHAPVKVLLMPNVVNLDTVTTDAPIPEPFTEEELAKIEEEFEIASRFFWVNSGMRYWADFQIIVDDRWQRWSEDNPDLPDFYQGWPENRNWSGERYRSPGGGIHTVVDLENLEEKRTSGLYEERPYAHQLEVAFPREWNENSGEWEYMGSGGGALGYHFWPDGIPSRAQYLGGGDTAWLTGHEFHHQMESMSEFGLNFREDERIVFNHYAPRERRTDADGNIIDRPWSFNGPHGEHWDGMAYLDRLVSDIQWLRTYFNYTVVVEDADMDGFPDDNPELPLDEARFGTEPDNPTTDGQLNDLDKAMLSTWSPSPLHSTWLKPENAGTRYMPKPNDPDSDGDGLPDGVDAVPLWPYEPFIYPSRQEIDGEFDSWSAIPLAGRWEHPNGHFVEFKHTHDDHGYYGYLKLSPEMKDVRANFDGEGDGIYGTLGTQGVRVTFGEDIQIRDGVRPAPGKEVQVRVDEEGVRHVEFSFPNRREGIWFWEGGGRPIGWSINFTDENDAQYSMYEPYRLIYSRMIESNEKAPLPTNGPPELQPNANTIVFPGDPGVTLEEGWQIEGNAWVNQGPDDAILIDVAPTVDFDLWVEFEANSDMILGAFTPGQTNFGAGSDFIAFVGGYANTISKIRLFNREVTESNVVVEPGERMSMQFTRRNGDLWVLVNGEPILYTVDSDPNREVTKLGVLGGYGGNQHVYEIRYRTE
jgi:hypothetical protein